MGREYKPDANKHDPEDSATKLFLDIVNRLGWGRLVEVVSAACALLDLVYPNYSQHRQCLSKVQAGLSPFEGVCPRQSEEVACDGIVDIEIRVVQISCTSRLNCDAVALLNEADGIWEEVLHSGSLEVQSWSTGEGSYQDANHRRGEGEELRVREVFARVEGTSEGGLVGERAQWMDIGEEIVDEQLEDWQAADRLCIEDST